MSTLLIDELKPGVVFEQTIRIYKSIGVAYIRPWVYKNGTLQDGQFRVQVYEGATLLKTVDVDYTEINTGIPSDYAHGYMTIKVDPLALNVDEDTEYVEYILKFSMVNHTLDNNNYIAICREWDDRKYPLFAAEPLNDFNEPCGYEIFAYRSNNG